MPAVALFAYAFLSNVALAVLPHEPAVIWYGARLGVWPTTLIATVGTVAAAFVDHRVFVPLIRRTAGRRSSGSADPGTVPRRPRIERLFTRAPFAMIAVSGLTPLPFFPIKALAFTAGYPMGPYLGAVAARCLPRYALLAWLGVTVRLPTWLIAALFAVLIVPSVRMLLWPRAGAS
jgi:membrane protein YqaA with SNARE-associated domain